MLSSGIQVLTWCLIVALRMKGVQFTPNATHTKRSNLTLDVALMSSTQRKLKKCLCSRSMFKNVFSMSAVTATSQTLNHNRISSNNNSHLSCTSVKRHNSPVWKIVNISRFWDLVLQLFVLAIVTSSTVGPPGTLNLVFMPCG